MSRNTKQQKDDQADQSADAPPDPSLASPARTSEFVPPPEAETVLILQQLEELKAKAEKAQENWDKYLRVVADFDNYKKRATRESQDSVKYANQALLERLLPVLDNFEAALGAANSASGGNVESLKTGITMIHSQLKSVLADAGLEEIDASEQDFNPNLHEAVSQRETTEVPEGKIVQQLRKGYKLRDRLVRPATVVLAKKPAS